MKYHYGKNVLVTGGSSGIGKAACELFAARGYTVFAACRRPDDATLDFPGGGAVIPVAMDVTDISSIDRAASDILARAEIGIVIHCAGIGICGACEDTPEAAALRQMNTNYHGVLRVNSRFLPPMRERGRGLCIVIGSVAGVFAIPFQSHYSSSKAALDMYVRALRMEMRRFGVTASLIMPGDTSTGFTAARTYEIDKNSPYYDGCVKTTGKMEKDEINGRAPSSVANVIFKLTCKKSPPVKLVAGFEYKLLVFLRRLLPERIIEPILRKMYI